MAFGLGLINHSMALSQLLSCDTVTLSFSRPSEDESARSLSSCLIAFICQQRLMLDN
jgi:hypothetical protein